MDTAGWKGPKRSATRLYIISCEVSFPASAATPACCAPQNPTVELVVLRAGQPHTLVTDGPCATGGGPFAGCFKVI